MLLLAMDTATPAVTVALYGEGRVLASWEQIDARRHGELLMPAVDRVLSTAGRKISEVTGLVVGNGPGPYTGLRVGLVTAAALGAARSVPVHGLCTLDGIAHAAGAAGLTGPFVVATDARRKEVYWARYDATGSRVDGPAVDRAGELPAEVTALPAVGAGAALYADAFADVRRELPQHASAGALAALAAQRLAAGEEPAPPRPLYLRRPDAQVPAGYKVVTP
ncbi:MULTISPECIES: tRNA (adenosine(37)-N6)-threonylcarbamoyltransferase complex dimerization subunit type 1 TsaB [unclassified Streptomyces]|uniref:tRNA (adenosine(37)-N6)-threonylcarbamoyltransferase complex dimerization subunit type 1 TsaB n=1 Tax=unclassified Streptomyces TaxID=2593676 RepID=UPI0019078A3A|nr:MULTISPECIES: tRNA (adenosine(37)-N6)-threonylcarbamoyltransferase complex dimerization subunit type 1 TsaB [unclassified Streptomyces]MCU4748462.1 tRNA (adenosine(37)-N6)-threonylcarbamoyltransferase complex dimerization subunit type 1 TsaB [Streptomyces sp. G-5]QQN79007.1 tRNA (adenosine(37)-N6)-threonylcarbamoyltransferase complex dimerization subunit type 1 TsaB [Streptomyces sp. XC 2026]